MTNNTSPKVERIYEVEGTVTGICINDVWMHFNGPQKVYLGYLPEETTNWYFNERLGHKWKNLAEANSVISRAQNNNFLSGLKYTIYETTITTEVSIQKQKAML